MNIYISCRLTWRKVHSQSKRCGRVHRRKFFCSAFPSSILPPSSLPLSSALAQDHINIPLKPVSTAARSSCPSFPLSPLSPPFLCCSIPSLNFCFICPLLFSGRDCFATGEGSFYYLQLGVPSCCTCAGEHLCARSHTHSEGWWIPLPLTDRVDWFRMVAASCRREERLFLDQAVACRERLRKALSVRVCKENCSL